MISRIGVIAEDVSSYGFLVGIHDRLKCRAELLRPTTPVGPTTNLTRRTARRAWRSFQASGANLIVRFVDADTARWQDKVRAEESVFPPESQSLLIVGVAVRNVEDWLGLDPNYIGGCVDLDPRLLEDQQSRSDRIKRAIDRMNRRGESTEEIVARIVRECPHEVFKQWLNDEALRAFYSACRQAAQRADCETPNELDANP